MLLDVMVPPLADFAHHKAKSVPARVQLEGVGVVDPFIGKLNDYRTYCLLCPLAQIALRACKESLDLSSASGWHKNSVGDHQ